MMKRFKNYITWRNKKGKYNTECNRASLETDLALTIPTFGLTKVAESRGGGNTMSNLRIRKLVPLETLKLMGFDEEDYKAMRKAGMTDSQIFHCAGDSIVTTVLMGIFGTLLPLSEEEVNNKIESYVDTLIVKES